MVDILAAPQQAKAGSKADSALRTLAAISVAHWSALSLCSGFRCCSHF